MNNNITPDIILISMVSVAVIVIVSAWLYVPDSPIEPIESTRNDDCKITVIGE